MPVLTNLVDDESVRNKVHEGLRQRCQRRHFLCLTHHVDDSVQCRDGEVEDTRFETATWITQHKSAAQGATRQETHLADILVRGTPPMREGGTGGVAASTV